MVRFKILGLIAAMALAFGTQEARADKSDDTLRIAWGIEGVMHNADNYYGATRAGIWFTKMVWDTLIERDPKQLAGEVEREDAGILARRARRDGQSPERDEWLALPDRV